MKVLVVDDDAAIRRIVQHVLTTSFEAEVCEVSDGLGALERLQQEAFDLMILDLQMPVVDGTETLQAIRRTIAVRGLPVVVISGAADELRVKQLIGLNVSAIIAKPFRPATLSMRLAPIIAQLRSTTQTARPPARLNLHPDSRLMLVGPRDAFQDLLLEHLGRVCQVDTYSIAATGLRHALAGTPDALFITGDDVLLPAAVLARKVRLQSRTRPRVYLCEPSAVPFSDDDRWFDGRLNKVSTSHALFRQLRTLLTNAGLAFALLPPASPTIEALYAAAAATIEAAMKTPVARLAAPPLWHSPDHRTIEVAVDLSVDQVAWSLELLVTHTCALQYSSVRRGGISLDQLSERDLVEATAHLVGELATGLQTSLSAHDLSARVGEAVARAGNGYAAFSNRAATAWLATSENRRMTAAIHIGVARGSRSPQDPGPAV